MSDDYRFTEMQLRAMTKAELVELGVLHRAVAANLGDIGTYQQAWAAGCLQYIPIDYARLVADAVTKTPPDASAREIVGRALRLARGYADPNKVVEAVERLTRGTTVHRHHGDYTKAQEPHP